MEALNSAVWAMCLLSAISGVALRGMDNGVLSQIGFVAQEM